MPLSGMFLLKLSHEKKNNKIKTLSAGIRRYRFRVCRTINGCEVGQKKRTRLLKSGPKALLWCSYMIHNLDFEELREKFRAEEKLGSVNTGKENVVSFLRCDVLVVVVVIVGGTVLMQTSGLSRLNISLALVLSAESVSDEENRVKELLRLQIDCSSN